MKIMLVFQDAKSHKFWQVTVEGAEQTIRFGKVGSAGQVKTKTFADSQSALEDAEVSAARKRKKGYVDAPGTSAPVDAYESVARIVAQIDHHLKTRDRDELEPWEADQWQFFASKPPADEQAILEAESALGVTLPDDYKAFLRIRNGTSDLANVVWGGLHQVEDLARVTENQRSLMRDSGAPDAASLIDQLDARLRPMSESNGWVVITTSARNRDHVCIDLDPDAAGISGQVFEFAVDGFPPRWLAASFTEFLEYYYYVTLLDERDAPDPMQRTTR